METDQKDKNYKKKIQMTKLLPKIKLRTVESHFAIIILTNIHLVIITSFDMVLLVIFEYEGSTPGQKKKSMKEVNFCDEIY